MRLKVRSSTCNGPRPKTQGRAGDRDSGRCIWSRLPTVAQLGTGHARMREGQTKINAHGCRDLRIGRPASQEHQALPLPPVASCLARFHTRNPLLQRGHALLQARDPPIRGDVAHLRNLLPPLSGMAHSPLLESSAAPSFRIADFGFDSTREQMQNRSCCQLARPSGLDLAMHELAQTHQTSLPRSRGRLRGPSSPSSLRRPRPLLCTPRSEATVSPR